MVQTVRIFTQDVRRNFGLQKCATIIMKKGKREEYDGVTLPNGEMMIDLGQDDYKYLGVLEAN